MNDKRIRESCPFCGTKASDIQIKKYTVDYSKLECPQCGVSMVGTNKQELINKWNSRYR